MLFSLLIVCFFALTVSIPVCADGESAETVRIGYYENEVFEEGASDEAVKTGYAYEYYRKLSEYTGWNYEYVYGSFGELYDMLLSGDIDLLAGLAKRDDRLSIIGYPSAPMGNEVYTLVKHDDDESVTFSPNSVSGKKIGVLQSAIVDILEDYLNENSINAEIVTFDDYESLFTAFDTKAVDVMAAEGDGAYGRKHAEVLCTFGTSDYYLCVTKDRLDILSELEEAQNMLAMEEPNYVANLQSKYYSSSVSSHTFSAAERQWLSENKTLEIGYLNDYLPYSATDKDGNVNGIIKDIIPKMLDNMDIRDLEVSYIGYDSYDEMVAALRDEKIDAGFPVGGGLYYSEVNGIYQSTSVVYSTMELVYKDEYREESLSKIAVNENNRMQYYYIRTYYPDSEIILYNGFDACLQAVLKGEAGVTTLNGLRANEILRNSKYKGLSSRTLSHLDDRCFGVKIGNEGLLKLLNHGVKVIGTDYPSDIANKYSNELYTYTLTDRLRDNMWIFFTMLLIIALLVIALIVRTLMHAQQANRMKTDFVSNMSHEIRTPITAILGMNEMIQMESNDSNVLHYAENIEKAGESLLGIINEILDFSKIEAGRMELNKQKYSLLQFFSSLHMMVLNRAEEKNLSLIMDIDERLVSEAVGDVQKLRQICANLLTNAVKYTKEGEVKFSAKLLEQTEDSFTMEVAVTDTGIGIKEEEMDKLFSAFDRLDLEKTRNIEGSGLGLAISRSFLALMGSEIKVESEYGKGSEFSFTVEQEISDKTPIGPYKPIYLSDDGSHKKKRTATFTAPEAKILIVDDTPMNLQVICGLLKGNEMNIETAESGDECIKLFADKDYDCVFLDQRMPNLSGSQTLEILRNKYPKKTEKTPIICLTANVLAGGREQMIASGFTDYLTKPVTLFEMENMLLKYLPESKIHKTGANPYNEEASFDEIPTQVKAIGELDIESGIEYCGDEEEYMEALKVYAASVADKASKIRGFIENGDLKNLTLTAHSVKSTSRAIGAKELSALAEEIEKKVEGLGEEERNVKVSEFLMKYEDLGNKIDNAIGSMR
ncbi:ATP-binding protein [Butyrivibrio sp. XPD2006]|uniref:ATP-binding protein n=1 Tax=Butyrivibrio sp. XPD2006 TaxID=1280668 RepID=UPI0003B47E88|nr:transporter substrate-binding domain-containing protein [Butyrivibrio sp. XPD2006]